MPEFIKNHLAKVENYTAGFLIFLVLAATALALTFSRTITKPLEVLSQAVQKLGQGDLEARVSIKSKDEFGDMGQVVNRVEPQLEEDFKMRRSLEVAMEVQQNLLPETPPELRGLDIYGMTLFSDETAGTILTTFVSMKRIKTNCAWWWEMWSDMEFRRPS
ncbi:MAG: HAMP domain-containing protein [Deltaproteobacteria bacterium]|nr:HAMP domain-containing protein [Deltaproteobacteria bacterium]